MLWKLLEVLGRFIAMTLKLTSFGLLYMNPNVCPLTAKLFILRKICRKTAQMHNEMQSKRALCQCENRQSSLAENEPSELQWSKMFLLVSNVSFMGVIIVLLTVRGEMLRIGYVIMFLNVKENTVFKCTHLLISQENMGNFVVFLSWFVLYSPLKCQWNHFVYHYQPESTKVIYSCPKNYLFSNAVTFRHFKVSKHVLGPLFTWANITISHMISSYNSEEQKFCKS